MSEIGGSRDELLSAPDRETVLARAFVSLADTLVDEFDVVDFLHGLTVSSIELLGAKAAGVMLADARGGLRLIASSEERMRLLELFELQRAQGPCLDAYDTGLPVQATAEDAARRWPIFGREAIQVGFHVTSAVPLRARGQTIGALNIFRDSDQMFTDAEMDIAEAMAKVATIGLIQERALQERNLLADQLQAALHSRILIEQAKGMLAEYLSTEVDRAFDLLRNYARANNQKLTDVALAVVNRQIPSEALA